MERTRRIAGVAALLAAAALTADVSVGHADNPPSGSSTGTGRVFFPNPVAQLQNQGLTDNKDRDYAALQAAYVDVTLTNLDGSGYLVGDYANVRSATGNLAYSQTNTFLYGRSDDRFEQVMAYYWVTQSQLYIQSLGFGSTFRPINNESQDVRLNQLGQDNSFSWEKKDLIRLGKGGVDDAEDAEVILHEYGHAMHDSQVARFGSSPEAGAIGEAFGDYWAVAVTSVYAPTADPACVADWDAVSYTSSTPHCLRRVDGNLHYPEDIAGEVHRDGRIWSRALWDIRLALGGQTADTLILEAQFDFAANTTFAAAAEATVATADELYGPAVADVVRQKFVDRGILGAALELTETTELTEATEASETTDPATTDPATTDPATTEPVTTVPTETTEASTTEPPATEPPATEPPATEPPVTDPPTTLPPVTEPPTTTTEPPADTAPATTA